MINTIHPIPAFADNYIWTLTEADSRSACVVDPGDAGPVLAYLEAEGLSLSTILITHHHADHTGGLARLGEAFQPVVYGPGGIDGVTERVAEGDEVTVFGSRFKVLEVPGHTLDHIAYFAADGGGDEGAPPLLFCGDTLFAAGCGRLFEGTPQMMFESLAKLTALPPQTQVYCTHEYTLANLKFAAAAESGNPDLQQRIVRETDKRDADRPTLPSTIALELATNPFLRCQSADIRRSVSAHSGEKAGEDLEVFTALRRWKDEF